jgi:hypothetical protein
MREYPILVTWSEHPLDFSIHQSLDEALEFIRQNPNIESLAQKEQVGEAWHDRYQRWVEALRVEAYIKEQRK